MSEVEGAGRHKPVFVEEVLTLLQPRPGGLYVDGTLGDGGHTRLLFERAQPGGRVIGFDRDPQALVRATANLAELGTPVLALDEQDALAASPQALREAALLFFHRNYSRVAESLVESGVGPCDGMLLDLGVSTLQLTAAERGFSFRGDGPLDMRMNIGSDEATAAELLAEIEEPELERILGVYGEERFARRIARNILRARDDDQLHTTEELANAVSRAMPPASRYGHLHPATRTFQALRIAVNHELEHLERFLATFVAALRPDAVCVVLSYHSLEDRLVKHAFRGAAKRGEVVDLTKRPLEPSEGEVQENPRARSAKLRAVRRAA